jgi:hypothetical protein
MFSDRSVWKRQMSASTTIQTPEYRKPRGWFRRHLGDPLARVLLARVPGPGAVLEVKGTGATRRIPIMIWPRDGLDYVVGLFGITPWVRDVRAGRSVRIIRGGRVRAVHLPELSPEQTAEYLRWYVAKYPGQGRRYLGLRKATGTLEEAQAMARRHPVFLIEDG